MPLVPGVVRTPDGRINIKGIGESQGLLLVDSAETVDPVTGAFAIDVPIDAIESLDVYKSAYRAEFGRFSGGLTSIETKPPSSQFHFELNDILPTLRVKSGHGLQSVDLLLEAGILLLGSFGLVLLVAHLRLAGQPDQQEQEGQGADARGCRYHSAQAQGRAGGRKKGRQESQRGQGLEGRRRKAPHDQDARRRPGGLGLAYTQGSAA